MTTLQLSLPDNLYLKDPQSTELGKKVVEESIALIDELGFESFTFKKLSVRIDSTEASVYRYFENKHRLLVYLISWYWNWLEYRIEYETHNLKDNKDKLSIALEILTEKKIQDANFNIIDESALQRIVIAESDKTYLTKEVDEINKEGVFRGYKSLCRTIAEIVLSINPNFPYPHSLVSTVMEASHHQIFFAQHLPSLTESSKGDDPYKSNFQFLKTLVFSTILV